MPTPSAENTARFRGVNGWRHLVEVHNMPSLGQRQYQSNTKVWEQAHREMHRQYDKGHEAAEAESKAPLAVYGEVGDWRQ